MTSIANNLILLFALLITCNANAGGVYQEPDAFVAETFNDQPPKPKVLWLKKDLKADIETILQHKYKGFRVRYWQQDQRTAWILEEIGKEKPITTGLVIDNGRIEKVRILIFRESRGWEVRHDFFTRQFENVGLASGNRLDGEIDNVSGATLSVRAVSKLARIALLLHDKVTTAS